MSSAASSTSNFPPISEFYSGKSVVVTGATGFLGKTLLEKLLRECPDLKRIYTLVRPAKDKAPQERVEEMLKDSLFDTLRKIDASSANAEKPSFTTKITAVPADLAQPGMGITDDSLLGEMKESVSIILHCAATVNFNEKLDISLATNVSSVLNLIDFSRSLNKLDAFVHVSTAYAHCDRQHIEEVFYQPTVDPQSLIAAVKSMSPETIASVTTALLGKRPNTYTLTKSLAEAVVASEAKDLPIAVVRPSIVGAIAKGPVPGWVDNLNGPGGFYLATAHNILRAMPGDPKATVDFVPVDHCVNMIVAVSWKLGVNPPAKPIVFNCSSGKLNPLNLGWHSESIINFIKQSPILEKPLRQPSCPMVTRRQYDYYYNPVFHIGPAMVIDFYRKMIGKKPMMRRLYQKINNSVKAYEFFSSQAWVWDVDNSIQLQKELREEDKEAFNIILTGLNWSTFLQKYYEGCKRFVKAPPKSGGMGGSLGAEPTAAPVARAPSDTNLMTSPSTTSLLTNSGSTGTLSLLAGKPTKASAAPLALIASAILLVVVAVLFALFKEFI